LVEYLSGSVEKLKDKWNLKYHSYLKMK